MTIFITLIGLSGLGFIIWPQPSINQDEYTLSEAYAVYSAILNDGRFLDQAGGLVPIHAGTSRPRDISSVELDELVARDLPDLAVETWTDFIDANDQSYPLLPRLTISRTYKLISMEELEALEQDKSYFDFWEAFHARYQGPLIGFSRVGFNLKHTQALVSYSRQMDGRAGSVFFLLLKKTGGVWVVSEAALVWIS